MVVEQCTKCGVKGCPELFGRTSEWRDVIPNDELCDSCRGDVEWRKDNVLVPLSDQVVKAAHCGEREILNRLVVCEARRGDNSWVARWVFIYSRPVRGMPGA